MSSWPLWLLLLLFVAAGALVWVAGIQLSRTTDVLDDRLHLGSALGGLVVLAVATNLPEIAITVSAALGGDVSVAVGNILGGIAIQTVVLVVLDRFGRRGGGRGTAPLTYRAASLTLVVEAVTVLAVLTAVVAGTQLPSDTVLGRVSLVGLLIAALWVVGLLLVRRASQHLPWQEQGQPPGGSRHTSGHRRSTPEPPHQGWSTAKAALVFGLAALATLVSGVVLERAGDAAAGRLGLGGVLFGATVLALATSLPEISTGLQAVAQGDDNLAISDIFGGNAFLPVLFGVATLVSGTAVLPTAGATNVYLTALAMLLTLVYVVGLVFRPRRRVLGMGVDSLVVLLLYALGIVGLVAVA